MLLRFEQETNIGDVEVYVGDVTVDVEVDESEIIDQLCGESTEDVIDFIKELETSIDEEYFTRELFNYFKERIESLNKETTVNL